MEKVPDGDVVPDFEFILPWSVFEVCCKLKKNESSCFMAVGEEAETNNLLFVSKLDDNSIKIGINVRKLGGCMSKVEDETKSFEENNECFSTNNQNQEVNNNQDSSLIENAMNNKENIHNQNLNPNINKNISSESNPNFKNKAHSEKFSNEKKANSQSQKDENFSNEGLSTVIIVTKKNSRESFDHEIDSSMNSNSSPDTNSVTINKQHSELLSKDISNKNLLTEEISKDLKKKSFTNNYNNNKNIKINNNNNKNKSFDGNNNGNIVNYEKDDNSICPILEIMEPFGVSYIKSQHLERISEVTESYDSPASKSQHSIEKHSTLNNNGIGSFNTPPMLKNIGQKAQTLPKDFGFSMNKDVEKVKCELCPKIVDSYGQLVRHVKAQHKDCTFVRNYLEDIRPLVAMPCPICKKNYSQVSSLQAHMKLMHKTQYNEMEVNQENSDQTLGIGRVTNPKRKKSFNEGSNKRNKLDNQEMEIGSLVIKNKLQSVDYKGITKENGKSENIINEPIGNKNSIEIEENKNLILIPAHACHYCIKKFKTKEYLLKHVKRAHLDLIAEIKASRRKSVVSSKSVQNVENVDFYKKVAYDFASSNKKGGFPFIAKAIANTQDEKYEKHNINKDIKNNLSYKTNHDIPVFKKLHNKVARLGDLTKNKKKVESLVISKLSSIKKNEKKKSVAYFSPLLKRNHKKGSVNSSSKQNHKKNVNLNKKNINKTISSSNKAINGKKKPKSESIQLVEKHTSIPNKLKMCDDNSNKSSENEELKSENKLGTNISKSSKYGSQDSSSINISNSSGYILRQYDNETIREIDSSDDENQSYFSGDESVNNASFVCDFCSMKFNKMTVLATHLKYCRKNCSK